MLSPTIPRIRKNLAIDALVQGLRKRLQAIPDPRRAASTIHSQADCLMAAFAMLMFLAFLVDQVQQLSCPLFAKAMGKFNNLESSHPPSKKPTRLR